MSEQFLSVRQLVTRIDTPRGLVEPVSGVDLEVPAGETLGIVGETGSGKSLLVRSIMGLLPKGAYFDRDSQVVLEGVDLTQLSSRELRQYWGPRIALIPQDPGTSLNPVRKVGAQLLDSIARDPKVVRAERKDRAVELLRQVGIADPQRRLDLYPHEMSGGMRQRVLIAIAVSLSPHLLIADEPTTALDVTIQRQILDLIQELQEANGMTVILVSHDLAVVAGRADRVAVMYAGRIAELIPGNELHSGGRHPYTVGLMGSQPSITGTPRVNLPIVAGEPPDIRNRPPGCPFGPRCAFRSDECQASTPVFEHSDAAHRYGVACFHPVSRDQDPLSTSHGAQSGAINVG